MDIFKTLDEMAAAKNRADTLNANIGSNGTNATYDKAQGNRGKMMNPTWQANKQNPGAPDDGHDDLDQGDIYGPVGGAD